MFHRPNINNNDEIVKEQYSGRLYHLIQPASIIQPTQSILAANDRDSSSFPAGEPRLDDRHVVNEPLPVIAASTTNHGNSQVFDESPAKRPRLTTNRSSTASSAPPIRKRFNPVLQNTGASQSFQ
ncbi:unnamed protein product [Rotaria sp. Silwood2]|nr:unnamed protein product [Rotaria sp. Silwood2]CAF3132861.1 unnamed protein product [Rotaria sp. Silwood2]CAF3136548.1 unnamed protein product [Rotaria sp. Silwood2]CAF3306727.1 unnamed protein product [Rotaria sp. Silwood2]CAF3985402.1 unnamed protein product [Rotaria sp. Silwood2]